MAASPAALPAADVAGEDFVALPRYPGSWRTAFHREMQGGTLVTDLAYVTDADVADVHGFYRGVFRQHGWEVIELDFSLTPVGVPGVMRPGCGPRRLRESGGNRVIEIELEQPQPDQTSAPQPSAPAASVAPGAAAIGSIAGRRSMAIRSVVAAQYGWHSSP